MYSDATLLGRRVRISLLHLLFDLIAGITARSRAGQSGDDPRVATADPAAQQPTDHCADTGTDQSIFIFGRLRVRHLLVMALLTRCLDRLGERLGADDLRAARAFHDPI